MKMKLEDIVPGHKIPRCLENAVYGVLHDSGNSKKRKIEGGRCLTQKSRPRPRRT